MTSDKDKVEKKTWIRTLLTQSVECATDDITKTQRLKKLSHFKSYKTIGF